MPRNERRSGNVGPPLPGIEIRIDDPDAEGVGEVIAKGPNVMAGYLDDPASTAKVLEKGWLRTGDLGKLDEEGHLVLVGRKKDLILDASGKNVYPDELEELYGKTPLLEELSIVGLRDERGHDRIACLAVARDLEAGETREDLRSRIRDHFAQVSADLPLWKRVKILHFWEGELPKTATRKVKRPQVVEELLRMERAARSGARVAQAAAKGEDAWLFELLADLVRKPRESVGPKSRLVADLGFDSLLVAELSVALEKAGVVPPDEGKLASLETAGDLARALDSGARAGVGPTGQPFARKPSPPLPTLKGGAGFARDGRRPEAVASNEGSDIAQAVDGEKEIQVPESIAAAGRAAIGFFQRALYGGLFDIEVSGKSHVPPGAPFLVAANHSSHLDVGLVKTALGDE